jgi:hypothetical protein
MPDKVKERSLTLPMATVEAVARLVLEAEAQVDAETSSAVQTGPVDSVRVTRVAQRLQTLCAAVSPQGLVGLRDRQIDTVDFETVFAALSYAAARAKADSSARGLPVTGR